MAVEEVGGPGAVDAARALGLMSGCCEADVAALFDAAARCGFRWWSLRVVVRGGYAPSGLAMVLDLERGPGAPWARLLEGLRPGADLAGGGLAASSRPPAERSGGKVRRRRAEHGGGPA